VKKLVRLKQEQYVFQFELRDTQLVEKCALSTSCFAKTRPACMWQLALLELDY
jgi:hypothetical protein